MDKLNGGEDVLDRPIGHSSGFKPCKGHQGVSGCWADWFLEFDTENDELLEVAPVIPLGPFSIHHGLGQSCILEQDTE